VEIGRGSRIAQSESGDHSYCDRICDIATASVAKFANVASCVRIGATDQPLHTAALQDFLYCSGDHWDDAEHSRISTGTAAGGRRFSGSSPQTSALSTVSVILSPANQVWPYSTGRPSPSTLIDAAKRIGAPSGSFRCSASVAVAVRAESRVEARV
jgi:hypothetical protein